MSKVVAVLTVAAIALSCGSGVLAPPSAPEQRGIAMPTYVSDGYARTQTSQFLREVSAAGAEWVQIVPTWYQAESRSSKIGPTTKTAHDDSVEQVIRRAHQLGLKVLLKPHVDVADESWRGNIKPDDGPAWFASYTTFITHYAELAERMGAEQFAVGTELARVSTDRVGWLSVVGSVRSRYTGALLYSANFNEYRQVAFWDAVDIAGINAYWSLSEQPTTDVGTLQAAWRPIRNDLADFAAQTGHPILFTEAGYTSQEGTTTAPFSWSTGGVVSQAEQAAGYQALIATFEQSPWWAGVFWWAWDDPGGNGDDAATSYSPRGKSAENVIRSRWTR